MRRKDRTCTLLEKASPPSLGAVCVLSLLLGCTVPLNPGAPQVDPAAFRSLVLPAVVDLQGLYDYRGSRVQSLPGGNRVDVDYDEFTNAVVQGIATALRARGSEIDAGADKTIRVRVVRIAIGHPTMTCTLDLNLQYGGASGRGLQVAATHFLFDRACEQAVSDAVNGILNESRLQTYLSATSEG